MKDAILSLDTVQIPAPANWQDFERLICDLYKLKWDDDNIQPYGGLGQTQKGIDLFGVNKKTGNREAIQCKCVDKLTLKMIRDDYKKAEELSFNITKLIFTTTAPRTTKLQDLSIELSDTGPFLCEVQFWDDIKKMLETYPMIFKKYYARIFTINDFYSKIVYLDIAENHYELLITKIPNSDNHYGANINNLLVADLQNKKCEIYSFGSHWSRLQDIIGYGRLDAFVVSNWINGFGNEQALFSNKTTHYFHYMPEGIS